MFNISGRFKDTSSPGLKKSDSDGFRDVGRDLRGERRELLS